MTTNADANSFKHAPKFIQNHIKNHEKIMQHLSRIGPKSLQNLLNSSLGSFWDVFGAISRPGRLQDAPPGKPGIFLINF